MRMQPNSLKSCNPYRGRLLPHAVSHVALLLSTIFSIGFTTAHATDNNTLNSYVLRAVQKIYSEQGERGYADSAYTNDLQFGNNGILKAGPGAPATMCVAAQLQVLVEALNIYAKETGDNSPFRYLPKETWERLRPLDFRGQIWVVKHTTAKGAADAFVNFGMGDRVSFKDLRPGGFLNFNRTDRSGHGVIFLGFVDRRGEDLKSFSNEVAGFKYFSANGRLDRPGGGFGYRWAFFSDVVCPALGADRKNDCNVIRTDRLDYTVPGFVRAPKLWDATKANAQLFRMQQSAADPIFRTEGTFRADYFTGTPDD